MWTPNFTRPSFHDNFTNSRHSQGDNEAIVRLLNFNGSSQLLWCSNSTRRANIDGSEIGRHVATAGEQGSIYIFWFNQSTNRVWSSDRMLRRNQALPNVERLEYQNSEASEPAKRRAIRWKRSLSWIDSTWTAVKASMWHSNQSRRSIYFKYLFVHVICNESLYYHARCMALTSLKSPNFNDSVNSKWLIDQTGCCIGNDGNRLNKGLKSYFDFSKFLRSKWKLF